MGLTDENFLVVEDQEQLATAVARALSVGRRRVAIAHTVSEARTISRRLDLAGAIVDLGLPDGSGFDVVRYLRATRPALPVLVFTATQSFELANLCQLLGVELAFKPTPAANLHAFVHRATWSKRLGSDQLGRHVEEFVREHDFTDREQEVIALALKGLGRKEIAEVLERNETTVKMQIRSMLRKSFKPTLGALVKHMLHDAWRARA